jgi:hypothetical protein
VEAGVDEAALVAILECWKPRPAPERNREMVRYIACSCSLLEAVGAAKLATVPLNQYDR